MSKPTQTAAILLLLSLLLSCAGGGLNSAPAAAPAAANLNPILDTYTLRSDVSGVLDPSIMRQDSSWFVYSTDFNNPGGHLPVRCSADRQTFTLCGFVFTDIPAWVLVKAPGIRDLWAPEPAFFGGKYHLYYVGSIFGTNQSVIGEASNTTLDPRNPAYKWVDDGEVIQSNSSVDYNTIDPSILVDTDGSVWLTFGSYWSGIKQVRLDPATGMRSTADRTMYALAAHPGNNAIEAPSLVHHGAFYYLFVSYDFCCKGANSTYRIMVGRSTSVHGPFVDRDGVPMMQGGVTQLLAGDGQWAGPGGQTVYLDPVQGDTIVFHAYATSNGLAWLHLNHLSWNGDWPAIEI